MNASTKHLTVLHVLNHSLPYVDGYAIRTSHILAAQQQMGFRVLGVTSPRQEGDNEPREGDGMTIYRTRKRPAPTSRLLRTILELFSFRHRIKEILILENPDILHVHSPVWWAWSGILARGLRKIPLVYEVRTLWHEAAVEGGKLKPGSFSFQLARCGEQFVLKKAQAIVAISNNLREYLIKRGAVPEKVFVAGNGAPDWRPNDVGKAWRQKHALRLPKFAVGYIGSLYKSEGIDVLLRAVELVRRRCPATVFLVVGSGPEEKNLKCQARQMGIEDSVIFIGKVPQSQVAMYYEASDVLVYPRLATLTNELITPLKPLEAMVLGRPIIVSNVGGLRELVPPGGALFFEPGRFDQLANCIIQLIEQPALGSANAERARDYVLNHRTWSKTLSVYKEVYESLQVKARA